MKIKHENLSGPGFKYLGHFAGDAVVRSGHNQSFFGSKPKKSLFQLEMEKMEAEKAKVEKPAPPPPAVEEKDKSKRRKQLESQIEKGGG